METKEYHSDSIDTMLSREQFEDISECLSNLAEKLGVTAILLVNSSGQTVAQKVRSSWSLDSTILSTLTASSYAAAKEMARILGERSNFRMVLHEGEHHNVYVSSVNRDFSLIIIFETGVALGMVRLFAKKTIAQLLSVLPERGEGIDKINHLFDRRFQSLLGEELDRTLRDSPEMKKNHED